jgi:hypothetical protein
MRNTKLAAIAMLLFSFTCTLAAVSGAAEDTASAGSPEKAKDWEFALTPYLWVSGLSGEVGIGGVDIPVNVGFLDVLGVLKGVTMMEGSIRYKRIGVLADAVWVKVGQSQDQDGFVFNSAELSLGTAFGTGAVFYRFEPKAGVKLDPYVGSRWWRVHPALKLSSDFENLGPFEADPVETWADFVVGARVRYDINEKWYVQGLADIGGGASKLAWQVFGLAGYRIKDWMGLEVGFRYLGVDYDKDDFRFDMKVDGLTIGLNFHI